MTWPTFPDGLVGIEWQVTGVELDGVPVDRPEGAEAFVSFHADGILSGSLGCNGFGAGWGGDDAHPDFIGIGQTMALCGDAIDWDEVAVVLQGIYEDGISSFRQDEVTGAAWLRTAYGVLELRDPAVEPSTSTLASELGLVLDAWLAEGDPPAPGVSLAVILDDGREVLVARGVRNLITNEAITTDDFFRIASITKTFTSVAITRLAAGGLIELDEPVSTYLGDWLTGYTLDGVDYGPMVTVRQILNHTDGFAEYAFDPGFYLLASSRLDQTFHPEEIIEWARGRGPQYVPGTSYAYNTVGHVAAGLVLEAVTGKPAHQVLREQIFDPLELQDIFLPPAESTPIPVVHGYVTGPLKAAIDLLPAVRDYTDADLGDHFDILALPQEAIVSAGWTGGGLEARPIEVARFFRAVFGGTLLGEEALAELLSPSEFADYGLGISLGEADLTNLGVPMVVEGPLQSLSHGGGLPGFRSHAVYYPDLGISMAMSANSIPIDPDVIELADRVLEVVLTGG